VLLHFSLELSVGAASYVVADLRFNDYTYAADEVSDNDVWTLLAADMELLYPVSRRLRYSADLIDRVSCRVLSLLFSLVDNRNAFSR